ncbi:MAG: ABC transporter, permease protein [Parcubacteria group bacterium GW2011_GWC2_39_14]|nr:MAG: ABC transporter, permease protein [Parcubacteria group bacterium GW2011_GWC2_39_14]KKR55158.1 MAG: ABC transporter, permease protein [Parcubacteria group bacterium GW2011_GWA2_40_23]
MLKRDLVEETYLALIANKVRSFLTVLGIVIGIGSVIAMIAIGQGSQSSIQSNIQSLGSNLIMVTPGAPRGVGTQVSQGRGSATTLVMKDISAIKAESQQYAAIAPELSSRYQVTAKGTNTNTSIVGVTSDYPEVKNIQVASGVFISDKNNSNRAKVAVVGPTVVTDLFGDGVDPVGQTIRIKSISFQIVGVTLAKGGSGFGSQDDMIFIPLTTAQQYLAGSDRLSTLSIQAIDANGMSELQTEITDILLKSHNISDPQAADFQVLNQADIVSAASSVTQTFTMLLGSVAAISLLVGGIGIMNMMLTNVTERTKEIGLRKAIGATRAEISSQFLIEAAMLTFLGGIFGVILGWLVALLVQKFGGITTEITTSSVLLAFGVSAAIGIVFGYYPALRASKLNPIEALRHE